MKLITLNQTKNMVNVDMFILGIQKMAHSDAMAEKRR